MKAIAIIAAALALLVGLYVGALCVVAVHQRYPWQDMDWNEDGRTSPNEFLEATDVGRRRLEDAPACWEYFSFKDGMPIKVVCNRAKQLRATTP